MKTFSSGEKAAVIVQDLLTLARRGVFNIQVVDLLDASVIKDADVQIGE